MNMKSLFACIPLCLLMFLPVLSCGREDRKSLWTPVSDDVDSLTLLLDSLRQTEAPEEEFSSAVTTLEAAASRPDGSRTAKARSQYWRAYMTERYMRPDSVGHEGFLPLLDSARENIDSASSPYDMARIMSLQANALPPEKAIRAYLGCYEAFADKGDYHSAAGSMHNLAYIYQHFGDYASADICYEKSIDLLEKSQPLDSGKYLRAWNHRAIMHRKMGDTIGAIEIARKVAAMELYDVSDKIVYSTERTLYYDRHDIAHLRRALESARVLGWESDLAPLFLTHFLTFGPSDSVGRWKEITLAASPAESETYNRLIRAGALRDFYLSFGSDSSRMYDDSLHRFTTEWNALQRVIDGHEAIRKAILEEHIANSGKRLDETRRDSLYAVFGAILAVIVAGIGIVLFLMKRAGRMSQNRSGDEVSPQLAAILTADITPAEQWEKFKVIFAQCNPGFKERLLKRHPDLTPGEYRLACLVRTSIDNKHIARLMGISPSSVYTNRFRLRQKLGLDPATNLDIYLLRL